MIKSSTLNHTLNFKVPAGTSRGIYTEKKIWYIKLWDKDNPSIVGIGEVAPLKGLSIDDREDLTERISETLQTISGKEFSEYLSENMHDHRKGIYRLVNEICSEKLPSIRFGLETALLDLANQGQKTIFPGDFLNGNYDIPINGLVWMGDKKYMFEQIKAKIEAGFHTIKIKVGAINFDEECSLLEYIRSHYSKSEITIRLDANGAFTEENIENRLIKLSGYDVHSIEQPIQQGQWDLMQQVCEFSPIPIALDEELIGVDRKAEMLEKIKPSYIILKPTLHGGLSGSDEWIDFAEKQGIGWWITSALESNIGLNAIAQFASRFSLEMPQGLGTGQLYSNNIPSPLEIKEGYLHYNPSIPWADAL